MSHLGNSNKMVGEDHLPDASKMVSDTLRTDAAYFKPGSTMYDLAGEMKRMERELNAANERIKRLEEAGDALYENSYPTRWDLPEANARKLTEQEAWRKAKEAKP